MEHIELLRQQLKEQEKLASMGLLTAGIAHELQNPLNFVINFSKMSKSLLNDLEEIMKEQPAEWSEEDQQEVDDIIADLHENMGKIIMHGERAINIVHDILLASRGKENEFILTDVNRLIKEYVWLAYHALRAKHKGFNITIHESYDEKIPLMMVVPQDLSRAILNLVNNACHTLWSRSMKENGDYSPCLEIKTLLTDSNQLEVTIVDNGEGMTAEVSEHLFDNFFTTKPIGEGTGLGMGITRDIIEQKHGGALTFQTEEGSGTRFTFIIPIKKA